MLKLFFEIAFLKMLTEIEMWDLSPASGNNLLVVVLNSLV
jgi:hypothetical protein